MSDELIARLREQNCPSQWHDDIADCNEERREAAAALERAERVVAVARPAIKHAIYSPSVVTAAADGGDPHIWPAYLFDAKEAEAIRDALAAYDTVEISPAPTSTDANSRIAALEAQLGEHEDALRRAGIENAIVATRALALEESLRDVLDLPFAWGDHAEVVTRVRAVRDNTRPTRPCPNSVSFCGGPDRYGDTCAGCLATWTEEARR